MRTTFPRSLRPRLTLVAVMCTLLGAAACGEKSEPQYFDPNAPQTGTAPAPAQGTPAPEAPPAPAPDPTTPAVAEPAPTPEASRPPVRFLVRPPEPDAPPPKAEEPTAADRMGEETALKAIGPNTSSADLMVLLRTHANKYVRGYAAELLGDRDVTEATDVLYAAMEDTERYVQRRAAIAVARIQPCRIPDPLLTAMQSDNAGTRFVAIGAATETLQLCGEAPLPPLGPLHDALESMIGDAEPGVRAEAVTFLGRLEDPERAAQRDSLLTDALSDGAAEVRLAAIRALADRPSEKALQQLIALMEDEDRRVQRAAITALATSGNMAGLEAVRQLVNHPDPDVRVRVAQALGALRNPDTLEDLVELLRDASSRVRYEAVKAVAKTSPEDAPYIVMQMLDDSDRGVRHVAAYNLAELCPKGEDGAEISRALAKAAGDRDADVAREAIRALRCMRSGDCVPELIDALCRTRQRSIREDITGLLERTTHTRPDPDCGAWREWLSEEGDSFRHEDA